MINESRFNNFFFISLVIILIAELILNFFSTNITGLFKFIFYFYIYISFLIIVLTFSVNRYKNINLNFKILIFFLLCISLFQLLRIDDYNAIYFADNLISAKFGNISYGPMFLIPIFILWGFHENAIYYLEKIALFSIKIGVISLPFCFWFNLKYPIVAFLPSFFLLSSYRYSNSNRKFWIIVGILLSFVIFYLDNYRSGILRLTFGIFLFFIIANKFRFFNKIFLILCFLLPILIFQNATFSEKTFFNKTASFFLDTEYGNLAVDTRSFLYKETFNDLSSNKKLLLGKGPLGSYYSPYFGELGQSDIYGGADHYIRSTVEVGLLHYLLKGGIIYFIIISLIFIFASFQSSRNDYINYLIATVACYYLLFTIENIPFFNFLNALIWIILGIVISPHNQKLSNEDIYKILLKK